MGKNFETKMEIMKSLAVHKQTLTDIYRQLGLSPSTVKQHLEELRELGLVQFVEDIHLHKGKYYEAVPYANIEMLNATRHAHAIENRVRMVRHMVVTTR